MKLRWSRRAQTQFHEAIVYLEEQRPGTGLRFHAAVGELAELVQQQPRACPRVPGAEPGEVRRALVSRYGYWLVFEILKDGAEGTMLAVWHTRRRPLGWTKSR